MQDELLLIKEKVGQYVDRRIGEFERLGREGRTHYDFRPFLDVDMDTDIFSELCFCILTANSSAVLGIKLQKEIGPEGFMNLSVEELTRRIAEKGHRFARQRAERIVKARSKWPYLQELLASGRKGREIRDLLSDPCSPYKVEGFGLKEASHFLRNIGFKDLAIVDRHILSYLRERNLVPQNKTLTRRMYLQAEQVLERVGEKLGVTLAELDLYIFYLKTSKVLK
ncbi:DNA-(apurinic or apyrimidinic site) lyase [Thermocrinis albus DSM 14484]|uniref:8-oxoguanine DNA glycosylase/AP lyase n=1 Tax=Thermocrinis albus (strain DSM 14484 / JCM 11386 / HI 11/12) TaxID=638303 RepID=D3SM53_THEAH|nr:N-glycosylase/DNA lyase [Thermocrinis albus]ADC89833.1 DNA-(apurinic or apyrimidinic site) lyase [Thermocrinis albus DSM 14484]